MLLWILFRNKYSYMSKSKARQDLQNFHLWHTQESYFLKPSSHFTLFYFRDKLRFCNIQIPKRQQFGVGHCECPQSTPLKSLFLGGVLSSSLIFILADVLIFLVQRKVTVGLLQWNTLRGSQVIKAWWSLPWSLMDSTLIKDMEMKSFKIQDVKQMEENPVSIVSSMML